MAEFDRMVGKVLDSVSLNKERDEITFLFLDGTRRVFGVEGDCCSHSWIEHLEMPKDIHAARILDVLEAVMPAWDGHECIPDPVHRYTNQCGHDSLAVYHTVFRTDRGDIALEYRNDSNGYYGGYLVEVE